MVIRTLSSVGNIQLDRNDADKWLNRPLVDDLSKNRHVCALECEISLYCMN